MRALFALAALLVTSYTAEAQPRFDEARWCTAQAVFIQVYWDCRYPTRAICEANKAPERSCLRNPNDYLYVRSRRL